MANICDICTRAPLKANSRSHSNIATRRRQYVNIQKKRINGNVMYICTRCLKTMAKKTVKTVVV